MTLHDPEGRLHDQLVRVLPVFKGIFRGLAVRATYPTHQSLLDTFAAAGARIECENEAQAADGSKIGEARRVAVALALEGSPSHVMYCDGDRALHWAEYHPSELAEIAHRVTLHDFTVLGRTRRAF